ncbi:MAG: hypothetical protein PWQ49_1366 [Methanohalophilus sp.]|nr:hypothetical protein [Methanohalophilus sp.]
MIIGQLFPDLVKMSANSVFTSKAMTGCKILTIFKQNIHTIEIL